MFEHGDFAFVDIETTGASPIRDRILEIAIVRVHEGKVIERFSQVLDPEKSVPPSIQALTSITEEEIRKAPTFNDIREEVRRLTNNAVFVAHNARFDYGFIKNEFRRLEEKFSVPMLCTVKLSRQLFPRYKRHDLSSIINRYDISCKRRHRALDDALVLVDFLHITENLHGKGPVAAAISKELKRPSLPPKLKAQTVLKLPTGPGVYIFYGEEGECLYVGKSVRIRERVMSHFGGDHASAKEMRLCQQIADIVTIETQSDLGALMLEIDRIRALTPLYNRVGRRAMPAAAVIELPRLSNGFRACSVERISAGSSLPHSILATFRSTSAAKNFLRTAAKDHSLCPKLIGIEQGPHSCFNYQIGRCKGACTGKEDVAEYNKRFENMFSSRSIKEWPYKGSIAIVDMHEEDVTIFIVNRWIVEGVFTQTENDGILPSLLYPRQKGFDYSIYRILERHIRNKPETIQYWSSQKHAQLSEIAVTYD